MLIKIMFDYLLLIILNLKKKKIFPESYNKQSTGAETSQFYIYWSSTIDDSEDKVPLLKRMEFRSEIVPLGNKLQTERQERPR